MMKFLKGIGKFLIDLFEVVVIIYVVLITLCILCRNRFGYTQFGSYTIVPIEEQTSEYIEDANPGNLLIVKNAGSIKVGDLMYFYAVEGEEYVVKSGIVSEITAGSSSSLYILSEGDNRTVNSSRVLGKYANLYPAWGLVLNILVSRVGFLFLVLLPIMVIFIYQIYQFIVIVKYEKDTDEDDKQNKKTSKKTKISDDDTNEVEIL